jgi:glycosyltransferase involved in cell wall biosynthesis
VTEVSVIVPARDAAETIRATLRALGAQTESAEVIVVDNGSEDATAEIARSSALRPRVIQLPRGGGPGQARNAGARAASGEVLAFTDADCEPEPGWLAEGLKRTAEADLIQGRVTPVGPTGPFDRTVDVGRETGLYETANLFVTRDAFEQAGGFGAFDDASKGPPFGEDAVFGWQCRRLGARPAFAAEALVRHAVFPRGPLGYAKERWRRRFFPALVREVPELRRAFLYGRVFLTRQTAAFDLAVAGGIAALALWTPWPALATIPYAWTLGRLTVHWRRRGPLKAAVELVADAVGLVALLYGSLAARSMVL